MIASNVDLPQPDGPNTTTNSPRLMFRSTPSRTRVSTLPWRNDLVMSSIMIRGKFSGGFDLITFPPNVLVVPTRISVTDTFVAVIRFNRFSLKAGLYCAAVERAKKIARRYSFVTAETTYDRPIDGLPQPSSKDPVRGSGAT